MATILGTLNNNHRIALYDVNIMKEALQCYSETPKIGTFPTTLIF